MDSNDFVSTNHILAEALVNVNDQDLRNGFTRGWFTSRIQDALQELAFDTFYEEITNDYDFPTDKLAIPMPKNAFNLREIYLYNSTCCSPTTSAKVHWKRLFNNNGGQSAGYTSKVTATGSDSTVDPIIPRHMGADKHLVANLQNGMIMFSSSCSAYKRIRLVYNGMGGEIGEEPIIPRFFERFINDWVEEKYYSAMKAREPRKYRILWQDAYNKIHSNGGSLMTAKMRISSMNTFEKESLEEYIGNIYAK